MKNKFSALLLFGLLLGAVLALAGCNKSEPATKGEAKYFCPMHPSYTSDRPGDCPICGMKLVPIKSKTTAGAEDGVMETNVPGRISIHVEPDKQQLIGVRTSPVEKRDLSRTVRTTGIAQHDETRLFKITPRFGGFVRKLFVNYIGQEVNKGDPLFTVYSPELFATEREYLLAYQQVEKAKEGSPELQKTATRLLDAAKKRLALWQINEGEIQDLEKRGEANDELIFRSPASGHVLTKTAVEGKSFMPGESLYEIADLTHLWLRAFVYEYELSLVKVGDQARVTFPNAFGQVFESKVTFISPHIDPQTRRAELRLELDNPDHTIKPDMWADVELQAPLGNELTVPDSAVIDTGTRFLAFVDMGKGHFEPREVKVGAKTDEFYQVLSGLKEGEKVVTRALFLIDSESQLKAAVSGMGAAGEHKH
jgi:Cu(I)/Ag(I) efflux system membrane fusion protein